MASAPLQGLPLFYNDLTPVSSTIHGDWRLRSIDGAMFLKSAHAVPLLSEEILLAHRSYPIVFSTGPDPVPLALMGLNDGVNVVVGDDGMFPSDTYVPAYVRRYPFILAKLRENSDDLSLCFDPTCEVVGPFEDGEQIFEDGQPSERTKAILGFCETFETSSQVTAAFSHELSEQKLFTDGEFTVQPDGVGQPYVYRGFQIISEEALKTLRGDVARKWIQNGLMPLIYAHLFSLNLMGDIFAKQKAQGKLPPANGPLPA
ncbi:MAG: multidrug transporter [Sphingomonas bacterium]|jgi:hypothetical protein|nr:multidrug transporter [Sphingomonas bacterium]